MDAEFSKLIKGLRRELASRLSRFEPIPCAAPGLPKASTFDAGTLPSNGHRLLVNIQPSRMAWLAGRVTINLIVTADPAVPTSRLGSREEWSQGAQGRYRIGTVLYGKDKWWHLRALDPGPEQSLIWEPSSYEDPHRILTEAVADMSQDIETAVRELGVAPGRPPLP